MKYELNDKRGGDPETIWSGNFIIGVDKSRNGAKKKIKWGIKECERYSFRLLCNNEPCSN